MTHDCYELIFQVSKADVNLMLASKAENAPVIAVRNSLFVNNFFCAEIIFMSDSDSSGGVCG
jgi:hypothetical protein